MFDDPPDPHPTLFTRVERALYWGAIVQASSDPRHPHAANILKHARRIAPSIAPRAINPNLN